MNRRTFVRPEAQINISEAAVWPQEIDSMRPHQYSTYEKASLIETGFFMQG